MKLSRIIGYYDRIRNAVNQTAAGFRLKTQVVLTNMDKTAKEWNEQRKIRAEQQNPSEITIKLTAVQSKLSEACYYADAMKLEANDILRDIERGKRQPIQDQDILKILKQPDVLSNKLGEYQRQNNLILQELTKSTSKSIVKLQRGLKIYFIVASVFYAFILFLMYEIFNEIQAIHVNENILKYAHIALQIVGRFFGF